jgi:hypothetical protein
MDGLGIESRLGRDFSHPSRPALGPTQPPVQWYPVFFPGVKRPGRTVDHPPPSNAEVKERVELYVYSPSGPSWPVLGRNVPICHLFHAHYRFCSAHPCDKSAQIIFGAQHKFCSFLQIPPTFFLMAVSWLKRLVAGLSPRRAGFDPGQYMWDLWWRK